MRNRARHHRRLHAALIATSLLATFAVGADAARAETVPPPRPARPTSTSAMQGVSVASNADGRLELFCICADAGPILHQYQLWPNGPWSPLTTLVGGTFRGAPNVMANADGRLELFQTDDNGAGHAYQLWPNGPWSTYSNIDTGGTTPYPPAVTRNRDGRLEIFFQRTYTNGVLNQLSAFFHAYQLRPNGPWSAVSFLNDYPSYGPLAPMSAFALYDGRLQLKVPSGAGIFEVVTQSPAGVWVQTTPSEPPGYVLPPVPDAIELNVLGLPTHLALASTSPTDLLVSNASIQGGWSSGWSNIGDAGGADHAASGKNVDGRVEYFWVDRTNTAWHAWETELGLYGGAALLGVQGVPKRALAAATNADGRLEVFFATQTGGLAHAWQEVPGSGPWSNTQPFS